GADEQDSQRFSGHVIPSRSGRGPTRPGGIRAEGHRQCRIRGASRRGDRGAPGPRRGGRSTSGAPTDRLGPGSSHRGEPAMTRPVVSTLSRTALVTLVLAAPAAARPEEAERPSGVVPLFNGKDLDGLSTWLRGDG